MTEVEKIQLQLLTLCLSFKPSPYELRIILCRYTVTYYLMAGAGCSQFCRRYFVCIWRKSFWGSSLIENIHYSSSFVILLEQNVHYDTMYTMYIKRKTIRRRPEYKLKWEKYCCLWLYRYTCFFFGLWDDKMGRMVQG